jgi:hypothetical protein
MNRTKAEVQGGGRAATGSMIILIIAANRNAFSVPVLRLALTRQ